MLGSWLPTGLLVTDACSRGLGNHAPSLLLPPTPHPGRRRERQSCHGPLDVLAHQACRSATNELSPVRGIVDVFKMQFEL